MVLKLETGKTYIDADGRKVRIIYTDMPVEVAPCAVLVDCMTNVNPNGKV